MSARILSADEHVTVSLSIPKQTTACTALMTKEHEPMVVRKYTQKGFPLYVALICGANLDDLDSVVLDFFFAEENKVEVTNDSIQGKRNIAGQLTDLLVSHYGRRTEGVAVIWYVDKMIVSSLFGDFMNHASCKAELYACLQLMCHI